MTLVQSVAIHYLSDDDVEVRVKQEPQDEHATLKTTHKSKLVKSEPASPGTILASISKLATSDVSALPQFACTTWGTHFLPTLYNCLGTAADPFLIDTDMLKLVQEIHDVAYPYSDYQVQGNNKIFAMVSLSPFYPVFKQLTQTCF